MKLAIQLYCELNFTNDRIKEMKESSTWDFKGPHLNNCTRFKEIHQKNVLGILWKFIINKSLGIVESTGRLRMMTRWIDPPIGHKKGASNGFLEKYPGLLSVWCLSN